MKYIYLIISIMIFGYACSPKDLPTVADISEEHILIKCSHLTTKSEIEEITSKLAESHDLEFDCSNCKFNKEEKLEAFFASILQDGAKLASCSADLMALQYKYYGFEMEIKDDQMVYGKAGSF